MSRQNNKTLQKHLAWLRATGTMSSWLEKRIEWDEETRNQILDEMVNKRGHAWGYVYGNWLINNPRHGVNITGISLPESEDTWLAPYVG